MPARSLARRTGGTWTENLAPGQYSLNATVTTVGPLVGTAQASVRAGQTTTVTITLTPGTIVAQAFIVSFRFNSAFVEPCARRVLREIAARATTSSTEKMLIVGHCDKTGSSAYNQALSERRARAVFAYLTFGRLQQGSIDEWTALRKKRAAGEVKTLSDSWDVREYQHMLQDLGFYPGAVDGKDGTLTQEAVRAFRCSVGLAPGTMDDPAWDKLIRRYLGQDNLAIPDASFFPNCPGEIVKWVGAGEEAPLPAPKPTRGTAFRPYRRVEVLFVKASTLPCQLPQPDTFDLPAPGSVNTKWCVGPGDATRHHCFGSRDCAQVSGALWCIQPDEQQTIEVKGSIKKEVLAPDGTITLVPATNQSFVLITPDGEFKQGEQASGEPVAARTKADGTFSFPDLRVGIYTLEVLAGAVVRLAEAPPESAKGPSVCKRLSSGTDTLDVVLVAAPVLRQIKLPVVAHLMTALHPGTRAIRTCVDPLTPGVPAEQRTVKKEADVRALFAAANRIWAQARVSFDVVEMAEEVFAHPDIPECFVTDDEFSRVLLGGTFPAVVNAYFFGSLRASEAGLFRSETVSGGGVVNSAEGVGMGDRVLLGPPQPPVLIVLPGKEPAVVLAHELGHYLTLEALPTTVHVDDTPANKNRLMLANSGEGHQQLVQQEIDRARSSPEAAGECIPLKLKVTGALSVGGARSGLFVTPPSAGGNVTVDAEISPELLAAGTVTMTGGVAGASPLQQTVSTANSAITKVVATYRPAGGGHEVSTFVRIVVTDFELRVEGPGVRPTATGTTFLARPRAGDVYTVIAELDNAPECITRDLVTWSTGTENVDPLRVTLPLSVSQTTVSATVGGVTKSVTIIVFDLSIAPAVAPFSPPLATVLVEGFSNDDLKRVNQAALLPIQRPSLFRARADIPGIAGDILPATVTSTGPDGAAIETVTVTLVRQAAGADTFVSFPLLAIPSTFTRADVRFTAPQDMDVVRARAGATIELKVGGMFGAESARATVRSRILRIFARSFAGVPSSNLATIRQHIAAAVRTWAQAGIEVQERSAVAGIPPVARVSVPGDVLIDVDHTDDFGINLTQDERQIAGTLAPSPPRSAVASDVNAYYVRSFQGPPIGIAFPNTNVVLIEAPSVTETTLPHEIGHHILINWPAQEHADTTGTTWPDNNIMHPISSVTRKDVDRTQIDNILRNEAANNLLVREPAVAFAPAAALTPPPANALVEGIANADLGSIRQANLVHTQPASLFRARADLTGIAANTVTATLTSTGPDNKEIEIVNLTLTRVTPGETLYVSIPILAIPSIFSRAELTFAVPKDMEVIRTRSGGTLTLTATGIPVTLPVRARVVHLFMQSYKGSGTDLARMRRHLSRAIRTWAQAGIEIKERSAAADVTPLKRVKVPGDDLLDVDHTDDFGVTLTQDEQQLVGRLAPSADRSGFPRDMHVYYVRTIQGPAAGIQYPGTEVLLVEGSGMTDTALSHEIGHKILVLWPGGDEHADNAGTAWPDTNVMHASDTANGRDVDRTQIDAVLRSEALATIVVKEP